MSTPLLKLIHCENTRRVMREALAGGWSWIGMTKSGHIEIQWPATGQLLHCATTPSDPNSWKKFATDIRRVSGLETHRKGNHRRSRKNPNRPDPQVEAARRRHARQVEAREQRRREVEHNRARQEYAAAKAAEEERQRREMENLMRPGWGH